MPSEMGCGSGMTCCRLRDWQADGTWDRFHRELLARLRRADKIDWSRALKEGRPQRKPDALLGDLAYDSEPHRRGLEQIEIEPVLPEREIEEQEGLGESRWPVERTLFWAHQNRRLRIRSESRPDIHQVFFTLAMFEICASALPGGLYSAVFLAPKV